MPQSCLGLDCIFSLQAPSPAQMDSRSTLWIRIPRYFPRLSLLALFPVYLSLVLSFVGSPRLPQHFLLWVAQPRAPTHTSRGSMSTQGPSSVFSSVPCGSSQTERTPLLGSSLFGEISLPLRLESRPRLGYSAAAVNIGSPLCALSYRLQVSVPSFNGTFFYTHRNRSLCLCRCPVYK